jgi:capsular polysaccharide biosynthesis protein
MLHHLVRRYGLLALLTVLGALAGGGYDLAKTPTYVATSYVVVTGAQGESQSGVNFAQAYGRIVTTPPVTSLAAKTLGSTEGLADVTASTSPDAPVIEITANGVDPQHTAAVANAVAQALVTYGATRADSTRVTLSVLAQAAVPSAPASPKPPLEPAIGAAAGLLVGGLAALAGVGSARTRPHTEERLGQQERLGQREPFGQQLTVQAYPVPQLESRPATEQLPWYPPPDEAPAQPVVGRAVVIYRGPR